MIINSSKFGEIEQGQLHQELKETEASRGSVRAEHMVAGAAGGDHVRGGGWRSTVPAAMLGRG